MFEGVDMYTDKIIEYYQDLSSLYTETNNSVRVLFVEDYSSDVENLDKLNLQFFRILKALSLSGKDYGFISSDMFENSWYRFKNLVVLGQDTLSNLNSSLRFKKYNNQYSNSVICIPSSWEMYSNNLKKKEGWEKLKGLKIR